MLSDVMQLVKKLMCNKFCAFDKGYLDRCCFWRFDARKLSTVQLCLLTGGKMV